MNRTVPDWLTYWFTDCFRVFDFRENVTWFDYFGYFDENCTERSMSHINPKYVWNLVNMRFHWMVVTKCYLLLTQKWDWKKLIEDAVVLLSSLSRIHKHDICSFYLEKLSGQMYTPNQGQFYSHYLPLPFHRCNAWRQVNNLKFCPILISCHCISVLTWAILGSTLQSQQLI